MKYIADCHCGRVRLEIEQDAPFGEGTQCNCSICSRRGHLLAFVPADRVVQHVEGDALEGYTFNRHAIRHTFCSTCGVGVFARGSDAEGNEVVALNLRCVRDLDIDALSITRVDGRSF